MIGNNILYCNTVAIILIVGSIDYCNSIDCYDGCNAIAIHCSLLYHCSISLEMLEGQDGGGRRDCVGKQSKVTCNMCNL